MSEEFLWKPVSESNGNLAILLPASIDTDSLVIITADGREIRGRLNSEPRTNGDRLTFRFPDSGGAYGTNIQVRDGRGNVYQIPNGSQRLESQGVGGAKGRNVEISGGGGGVGTTGGGTFYPQSGSVPGFPTISAPQIPRIQVPVVDPIDRTTQVGDFNTAQFQKAFDIGKKNSLELVQLDFDTLQSFFGQAQGLQRGAVSADNAANRGEITASNQFNQPIISEANKFNQEERLTQLERALPGARNDILAGMERGRTLSEGRFIADAEDRAFEVAARDASSESSVARGFGDDSVFGRRASDLLSAQQRLQLSQVGDQTTSRFLQLGANLAFDQPIKHNPILQNPLGNNLSQQIPGKPSSSGPELATQQQTQVAQLSTIPPSQAIGFDIGQNQYQAGLDREADKVNATFDFEAQKFNSTGIFQSGLEQFYADTFNAQQQAGAQNFDTQSAQAQENFGAAQTTGLISASIGALGGLLSGGGDSAAGKIISSVLGGEKSSAGVPGSTGTGGAASGGSSVVTGADSQLAAAESYQLDTTPLFGTPEPSSISGSSGAPGAPEVLSSRALAIENPTFAGPYAVPVGIALVAATSGRGIQDTVRGITDGSITKQDVKTTLANTLGPGNFSQNGVNAMFGRPIHQNDINNAMLLSNPITAPIALADMMFGSGGGKSEQQQERDSLREHGVDTGMFFHPSEEQAEALGMKSGSQYVRQASGGFYNIGRDGGAKIQNAGINIDGNRERHTYDIDWSDKRTPEAVGLLNPLALITFGPSYQRMMGHVMNAASSDTKSLSGMHANFREYARNADIDYNTGLRVLGQYRDSGELSQQEYAAFVGGWNDLMLTEGVQNEVIV